MWVCYFGSYDRNYSRNRILIKGLRRNNVNVFECNDLSEFWTRWPKLIFNFMKFMKNNKHYFSSLIVGAAKHSDVFPGKLLKFIYQNKFNLVFDVFISAYDTAVMDRKLVKPDSIKAKYYYMLDKLSCGLADIVIVDTKQHLKYFNKEFGIPRNKIKVIYVGSDNDFFYPRKIRKPTRNNKLKIYFYGTFIPLHGIEYIVEAANILKNENIEFYMIGKGQTYNYILSLVKKLELKNVKFLGTVKYEKLPIFLSQADICLGIFGSSDKAKRVIPNKVFDALAMKKPIITADTPAIREVLRNKKNVLLCEPANPYALADAILELKYDCELRRRIAVSGYRTYINNFTPEILGAKLKEILYEFT